MKMNNAEFYINKLKLTPHPEGGYFHEIYRSEEKIKSGILPDRYSGERSYSTSIYFLLKGEQKSHLHKLKSDEIWHFYKGSSVRLYIINKYGKLSEIILGENLEKGETFQYVIKKDQWFCANITDKKSFALVGCTVSPGFDFSDFEIGKRNILTQLFPEHTKLVTDFTVE